MNANEIADRLDGAAALIEENGGCYGFHQDRNGRHCIIGAALKARYGRADFPWAEPALMAAREAWDSFVALLRPIATALGYGPDLGDERLQVRVFSWNDAPGRTDAERAALLRKAAQLARQQAPVAVAVHA